MEAGTDRLSDPPLDFLKSHKEEVVPQTAAAMHDVDLAHVVMLTETGILPTETGVALLQALLAVLAEGVQAVRCVAGGGNHAGERVLTARLGQALGGCLGLARSSGDLSALSIRLYLREAIGTLDDALGVLRATLLDFAGTHCTTVMVGTTHGQHAQIITLGHWALMAEAALARDAARLSDLHGRVNCSPAGAGIMAGTRFPVDRARMAALLGFDAVLDNMMDAVLAHDLELEHAATLLNLAQTLARLADDLMLWSTFEYGMIELPDWFCGTSSLMPQKKNPDGLEDLKSLAAEASGLLAALAATERGPTGYPIIERRTSDALLRACTERMMARLAVLPRLFETLHVDTGRMRDLAGRHWAQASDLAALLVERGGLDWRRAHGLIGAVIRRCLDARIAPDAVSPAILTEVAQARGMALPPLSAAEIGAALDPVMSVARRDGFGGPAPEAVLAAVTRRRGVLEADRQRATARRRALEVARAGLIDAARTLVDGAASHGI